MLIRQCLSEYSATSKILERSSTQAEETVSYFQSWVNAINCSLHGFLTQDSGSFLTPVCQSVLSQTQKKVSISLQKFICMCAAFFFLIIYLTNSSLVRSISLTQNLPPTLQALLEFPCLCMEPHQAVTTASIESVICFFSSF